MLRTNSSLGPEALVFPGFPRIEYGAGPVKPGNDGKKNFLTFYDTVNTHLGKAAGMPPSTGRAAPVVGV